MYSSTPDIHTVVCILHCFYQHIAMHVVRIGYKLIQYTYTRMIER